jgi:hypothetical protein
MFTQIKETVIPKDNSNSVNYSLKLYVSTDQLNDIEIKNDQGDAIYINPSQVQQIFELLLQNGFVTIPEKVNTNPDSDLVKHKVLTLVTLPPQTKSLFLTLEHEVYTSTNLGHDIPKIIKHVEYMVNVHSCPSNWLQDTACVSFNGDGDPHGLFRHVRTVLESDAIAIEEIVRKEAGMENRDCSYPELDQTIAERIFPEIKQIILEENKNE